MLTETWRESSHAADRSRDLHEYVIVRAATRNHAAIVSDRAAIAEQSH
jgi:hypothetical protein